VPEVIVALDTPSMPEALALVERLGSAGRFYKVGLELYTSVGPAVVGALLARDKRVFLDLKLHDIPNTVAGAVRGARGLGVHLLTVHAAGGAPMLEAAREAAAGELAVVAVTILTSLDSGELGATWGKEVGSIPDEASRLALLAKTSGIDGVVASASEAERIRLEAADDFIVVVPGIRLAGSTRDDQRRVATPADAVRAGADYLVVGRAVTRAQDPAAALATVLAQMDGAQARRA
jgi:orotidine-5'-phosphate decarboxylase